MNSELPLTQAMEDYLKAIYRLHESHERVTTQALAERLAVAPASVTSMVKRLAEHGLLSHERYRGVELTALGERVAQEMIRHHRLLELYLTQALGFDQDQVHAEAERLEHFISEQLEDRIDQVLGRPTCDPHGSPIPQRPNTPEQPGETTLDCCELYQNRRVVQTSEELGIQVGESIVVLGRPAGAMVHVRIGTTERLLDPEQCAKIQVC